MAVFVITRKAERHRSNGNAGVIVKRGAVDTHPVAQSVAGTIIEGEACLMDTQAGRLAHDEKPCRPADLQHRTWLMGQMRLANPAGADVFQHCVEVIIYDVQVLRSLAVCMIAIVQLTGRNPIMQPVRLLAMVPDRSARIASCAISSRRSGTRPDTPAIIIPTEPKFAKPHMA